MYNENKKKVEDAILLQFKNRISVSSLTSKTVTTIINKSFTKKNLISFPTADGTTILVWENNGKKIYKLNLPLNISSKKYLTQLYESGEDLKMVKLSKDEGDKTVLLVCDQPKYIKLFSLEDNKL